MHHHPRPSLSPAEPCPQMTPLVPKYHTSSFQPWMHPGCVPALRMPNWIHPAARRGSALRRWMDAHAARYPSLPKLPPLALHDGPVRVNPFWARARLRARRRILWHDCVRQSHRCAAVSAVRRALPGSRAHLSGLVLQHRMAPKLAPELGVHVVDLHGGGPLLSARRWLSAGSPPAARYPNPNPGLK